MVSNISEGKENVLVFTNEMSKAVSLNCGQIICNQFRRLQYGMCTTKFNAHINNTKI